MRVTCTNCHEAIEPGPQPGDWIHTVSGDKGCWEAPGRKRRPKANADPQDERDHEETMPGEPAAEDITHKFTEADSVLVVCHASEGFFAAPMSYMQDGGAVTAAALRRRVSKFFRTQESCEAWIKEQNTDPSLDTDEWPDPLNYGWAGAWKRMADQLAAQLEGLLVHFGNEDQTRGARAALEAHENFTSYDDCHGTGKEQIDAEYAAQVAERVRLERLDPQREQNADSVEWRDIPLGVLGEIATAALAWYDARYPNLDPSKCFMSSDALLATIERHGLRDRDAHDSSSQEAT